MIYFLKCFKGIVYFLVILSFSLVSNCTDPVEEIVLPEGWENIPGVYKGAINKQNKYPPHDKIYIKPFKATIVNIGDYYSIEFEKNDSIQLPKLSLEVFDSRQHYIYFDIMDTPDYITDNDLIGNNQFVIVIDNPFYPAPEIRIRLKLINGDYSIIFHGTKYL